MIAGYVLIQTEVGMATVVAAALQDLPGVSAAASVAGPYDVIVRVQARTIDQLGRLVASRIQPIRGVLRTITCPIISRPQAGPGDH
jgi:DNA-binding Lrp family transcriptional regulator